MPQIPSPGCPRRRGAARHALPVLLAALAPALLALPGCDAADPFTGVPVAGTIANSHGRPVAGATVSFDTREEGQSTYVTATTDAAGRFAAKVPPGAYSLVTAASGYDPTARTVTVGEDGHGGIVQTVTGSGSLTAQFLSALTGLGAPGVELRCARRNADGSYPDPATVYDFSAVTNAEGTLTVAAVPTGPLRCRAEGPTFDISVFDISVRRDGPTALPPFAVTPPPPEGALRFVLTWGQNPRDLDSHLTGPDGIGGRFHVNWMNRSFGQTNLDVDDVDSYGPETITVFPQAAGTYRYSVHNWSDQSPTGAQGIALSPTRVEVHDHRGRVCMYRAPQTVQAGNAWRVLEVEAREADGGVAFDAPCARGAVDLPGLGYVSATGTGDLGTFLTSPPPKGRDG